MASNKDNAGIEPESKVSTFAGTLQLKDFMYASSGLGLRRSPRQLGAGSLSAVSPSRVVKDVKTVAQNASGAGPGKIIKQRQPNSSVNPSKTNKKKRSSSGYAPPSTYAHLPGLPDAVAENLLVFFVGLNPGIETARSGHAYAHPSNLFWKLLFSSGVTPRPCTFKEDRQLPQLFSLGFTNIVSRPSRNGSELSKQEMDDGVAALHEKARRWRPECMCIVGKSIWESIWRVRHGRPVGKSFKYGWQDGSENMGVVDGEWAGAKVFVASSTSGLAATLSPAEKQRIWGELGSWVKIRRAERDAEERREKSLPGL